MLGGMADGVGAAGATLEEAPAVSPRPVGARTDWRQPSPTPVPSTTTERANDQARVIRF